jgi:hypothetical protein
MTWRKRCELGDINTATWLCAAPLPARIANHEIKRK